MKNIVQKIEKSFLGIFVVLALALFVTPGTAHAQQQICGNSGSGYCINDWNNGGLGNQVKMYYGNSSNENFHEITVDPCNNGGFVSQSGNCPFTYFGFNTNLNGHHVVELEYAFSGDCIGAGSGSAGALVPCGDSHGNGAGQGAIMVQGYSFTNTLVDRYWTNKSNGGAGTEARMVCSGGSLQSILNINTSQAGFANDESACQWGGLAF